MKILINERLSEHRCKTPEGYLICTDAILARTGKQTYRKNEIFKDSDDETEIEVDRTEDEVFSPQTLASFENKPVTVEHPDEDVNVHNYKEYAVGFVRDVHRGVVNGQPVILGNLVITDEKTIQEIENGEHTDLSCGYDCDIADEPNPCQRNIRGNHVALCECGRAGIARIVDSRCEDANHLPAKVKRDLQKFLNHKSTFIRNRDYDISEFVKEFERVSRLWVEFPLKIVRESIKGWFKTGDGMMRKDYVFSIEGYDDRFMVSIYAKPDTYETTELNAYFTDSVKDAKYVIMHPRKNLYLTVGAKTWSDESDPMIKKFDSEKEAEEYAKKNTSNFRIAAFDSVKDTKFDVARGHAQFIDESPLYDALHTFEVCYFDNGPVCIMLNANSTEDALRKFRQEYGWYTIKYIHQKDSTKDALIPPTKEAINKFEALLRISDIKIDSKGLTTFGRVHYQVRANMEFDQFVKRLNRIDNEMDELGIPMTFNAGSDGKTCTAGIDLDKQHVNDSQRAQKIQKIIKVAKSIK